MSIVITDKQHMYTLLNRGAFGNTSRRFNTLADALAWDGTIGVRTISQHGHGGGEFYPNVSSQKLPPLLAALDARGVDWNLTPMAPDMQMILGGYVYQSEDYWTLDYTLTGGRNLRDASADFQHATGMRANTILKERIGPPDWDDFCDIAREYYGAVIEFSVFECWYGTCPRRNTIIWEVRHY